jgi:lysyl-tRNA synthetase, class I
MPPATLSPEQTAFLSDMATLLEEKDLNPEELHDEMYNILREHDLKPQKAFQAIYRVVIGKKMGPRAASFILSLDKDFVIKRLRLEE